MSDPIQKDILDDLTSQEAQTPEKPPIKDGYAVEVRDSGDSAGGAPEIDHTVASGEK